MEAAEKRTERERAPEDYLALAINAWQEKNVEEGLGWAYFGLNLNPKNNETKVGLYNVLGSIYQGRKWYKPAEENYKKALEINEKAYLVHYNLGIVYYDQKLYDNAERQYKETLRLKPDFRSAYNNLAFILFDIAQYEEALNHFNTSIEIKTTPDSYAGKAISLSKLDQQEEALSAYKTAVSQDSKYLDLTRMRNEKSWSEQALEAARELIDRL